ncbi:hypothetical protein JHS3_15550 [Jeongeupia sp. HS-3]|uniref:FliH/SctL family protein n=1 Tax=Jeongeupia sp. HS-3 TaxID=1009682 RepID=UPI0018A6072B|nr:FliH/SctL family protein [Jeongeupia sp. HS-3]BCL75819.1 hypothetical protein JHS3_15550 [Jeongeupia sp. HS-3]
MAGPIRRVIPREELTAWERWELGAIDEERRLRQPALSVPAAEPAPAPPPEPPAEAAIAALQLPPPELVPVAEVSLPTAEDIEAIEQQAMREGFDAGLEAGRLAADEEVGKLKSVLQALDHLAVGAEGALAESVLDLALVLARELIRRELVADRQLLLPAITEALTQVPAAGGVSRLYLHPDDLSALEPMLAIELSGEQWHLVADPRLALGDARIETVSTRIDLALPTRWATLLGVLGRAGRDDLGWAAALPKGEPDGG